jgi:arylsulfatase A-like enzyme
MKRTGLVLVVAALATAGLLLLFGGRETGPPSLVLVTIDTLRADHLDAYGYARPTAPHLARLAEEGTRFEYGLSQAPWTLPSLASIHTSLHPFEHGAVSADARLPEAGTTLAEVLAAAGYHTVGVVSHVFAARRHGLAQGFVDFDESRSRGGPRDVSSPEITDLALERVAARSDRSASEGPFFLWVHYFDPHDSYVRHPEFAFAGPGGAGSLGDVVEREQLEKPAGGGAPSEQELAWTRAVYDEEIAFTDAQVGRLIEGIDALERPEGVVYVVTADHGEMFMEHGSLFHGYEVWNTVVRVPLIFGGSLPDALRGSVVRAPVETASIPATLAGLARVPEHPFAGADLLAVASGAPPPEVVFAEGRTAWVPGLHREAAVGHGFKLIRRQGRDWRMFDLERDPQELHDLSKSPDPRVARARRKLRQALAARRRGGVRLPADAADAKVDLSEEELRQLEALGYADPETD